MIEKVINFGSILDGFWKDFGRILGDFWHLFWSSISDGFPSAIQDGFWTIWASKMRGPRGSVGGPSGYFLALGAVFGPNWPQEASRIPPRSLLEPILKNSGPNLLDFGSQSDGFWVDFATDFY